MFNIFHDGYGKERKKLVLGNIILSSSFAFILNSFGYSSFRGVPAAGVKILESSGFPILTSWCGKMAYKNKNISELESQLIWNVLPNIVYTSLWFGLMKTFDCPRAGLTALLSSPALLFTGFTVYSTRKGKPLEEITRQMESKIYEKTFPIMQSIGEFYTKYVNI